VVPEDELAEAPLVDVPEVLVEVAPLELLLEEELVEELDELEVLVAVEPVEPVEPVELLELLELELRVGPASGTGRLLGTTGTNRLKWRVWALVRELPA
jgi:hypothetical protein